VAFLSLLLLVVGALVALAERRHNPEQFGGSILSGIGSGFWWSAVTMTTVGYGDKAPRTVIGRVLGLIWMFATIIIISSFTASITSSLTISELSSNIRNPEDLGEVRVGTVEGSTSARYLEERTVDFRGFDGISEALYALARGDIDAVVYDVPILRYLINENLKGRVMVLPGTFERQDYGFCLPDGSELREEVNRFLLKEIQSPDWKRTLFGYFGD
jgi:ABC-type amino acid transport substrate-binding protein